MKQTTELLGTLQLTDCVSISYDMGASDEAALCIGRQEDGVIHIEAMLAGDTARAVWSAMQSPAPSAQVVEALGEVINHLADSLLVERGDMTFWKRQSAALRKKLLPILEAARQPASVPSPAPMRSAEVKDAISGLRCMAQENYSTYGVGQKQAAAIIDYIAQLEAQAGGQGWQTVCHSAPPQWTKLWLYREDVQLSEIGFYNPEKKAWLDWDTKERFNTDPSHYMEFKWPDPPAPPSEAEGR